MNKFNNSIERLSSLGFTKDYADLSEKEFRRVISQVNDIRTLEGIANRRKILNANQLKKWSEVQRSIILEQKFIIEAKTKVDTGRRGKARATNVNV